MNEKELKNCVQTVGTLNERTLHRTLKELYSKNSAECEVRLNGYIADIFDGTTVTEIQSGQFFKLTKKLNAFSEEYKVKIVYPVAAVKWISWIDDDTGEIVSRRKSPKKGAPYDILDPLYDIRQFIFHPNVTFEVALVTVEEYRILNGFGKTKKRRACHYDKIPVQLGSTVLFCCKKDYLSAIPPELPCTFTSAQFSKAVKRNMRFTYRALKVLEAAGAITRCGKSGKHILYKKL